jgi:hypothetical protein
MNCRCGQRCCTPLLYAACKWPVPRSEPASELGALGGTRTPNLLIRRFQCRRSYPFTLVRDLGFVSPGCPHRFGASRGCSSVWLPAWLPRQTRARALAVGFQEHLRFAVDHCCYLPCWHLPRAGRPRSSVYIPRPGWSDPLPRMAVIAPCG